MVEYRDMLVYWYTGVLKCPLCVCVFKLPATIFIGTGPNLDTTCISKMSRGTFLDFFEILNFDPLFDLKTHFLRPKMLLFVRHSTYTLQFSSEWDQIWTQHVFLKCLEVLF